MLAAFHVSENHEAQSVLDKAVNGTVDAGRIDIHRTRVQQEDVGLGAV